jgi:uncharacterized protein
MKRTLLALVLAPALFLSALGAQSAAKFPPHTIGGSELRELPRTEHGRHYQLHIGLPASYHQEPNRHYPVVYVTDGYWDFQKITGIHGSLVYDRVAPEFITVGLGYVGENLDYGYLRRWELSPVPFGDPKESGRAADFLQTISNQIIPFVEREYRADPSQRVLAGASMGGLFTLFSMYTQPELFQGYIAVTPAVVIGNNWLLDYEAKFAASGRPLPVRLHVTVGSNESPGFIGGILRYNQRVSNRKHDGLAYEFKVIEGERHAGMQFEAYVRGLRFVFAPLAPETGPASAP